MASETRRPSRSTAPADRLRLDRQLCFALYSGSLVMTRLYKPLLTALGLSYPQYLVLLVLWETDGIGVSELGERLYLDSGTLTPLLKRMETSGWLTRARALNDERRVIVTLTLAGRTLKRRAQAIPEQVARAAGCPLEQLTELTTQLQALRANVSARLALAA